jgi:hypothetical protein
MGFHMAAGKFPMMANKQICKKKYNRYKSAKIVARSARLVMIFQD